jgi:UDP:flavonoid glycosyltransferase YjiC (YdhE family)
MTSNRRFLFVTWDGGGNLPPALGIAHELMRRGHSVHFLGHATQRQRVEQSGFTFGAFERSPAWDYSGTMLAGDERAKRWLASVVVQPAMAEDVRTEAERHESDALMVDCVPLGALAGAELTGLPAAVLVHTFFSFVQLRPSGGPVDEQLFPRVNNMRSQLGLPVVSSRSDAFSHFGRVLVASIPTRDLHPVGPLSNVRFVGPIFEPVGPDRTELPWSGNGGVPLVLLSFSTANWDGQNAAAQQVLDALASLPVQVLFTTGPALHAEDFRLPANAVARAHVPHQAILPRTSLVVTHAGHGTIMAALANGVPLLCLPLFADQPLNAAWVERAGAGRILALNSEPTVIRTMVQELLDNRGYRDAARNLAQQISRHGGAHAAGDELEALASERPGLPG